MERCKSIYDDSDIMIIMPGGTGTLSEMFNFLEELRTNEIDKELIIYNKDNYYIDIIKIINTFIKNNFNDETIFNYLKVFNDKDDLIKYIKEKENNDECR